MAAEPAHYCPHCLCTFPGVPEGCPNLSCGRPPPASGWGEILPPGALLDRHYRVQRTLALGGGGLTYLAREVDGQGEETGPKLAIKVLFPGRDSGPFLTRLANEARILAELNHPNIVECLGFVQRAGHLPYLVTRFEEGGTLLDHVRRAGPMPAVAVAAVGRQLAWALALAHSRGVIHRDMKPENVLLTQPVGPGEAPAVRVADFGVARLKDGLTDGLTRAGAFVGTPAFAAPEQLAGAAPAPSTDLYGLGAVLTFCATGEVLLPDDARLSWGERRAALLSRLPPRLRPRHGDPEATARLEKALSVAMAVKPEQRGTAATLDSLLAAVSAGATPTAAPPREGGAAETMALERDAPPPPAFNAWAPPARASAPGAHAAWSPPKAAVPPSVSPPPPAAPAAAPAPPARPPGPPRWVLPAAAAGLLLMLLSAGLAALLIFDLVGG